MHSSHGWNDKFDSNASVSSIQSCSLSISMWPVPYVIVPINNAIEYVIWTLFTWYILYSTKRLHSIDCINYSKYQKIERQSDGHSKIFCVKNVMQNDKQTKLYLEAFDLSSHLTNTTATWREKRGNFNIHNFIKNGTTRRIQTTTTATVRCES